MGWVVLPFFPEFDSVRIGFVHLLCNTLRSDFVSFSRFWFFFFFYFSSLSFYVYTQQTKDKVSFYIYFFFLLSIYVHIFTFPIFRWGCLAASIQILRSDVLLWGFDYLDVLVFLPRLLFLFFVLHRFFWNAEIECFFLWSVFLCSHRDVFFISVFVLPNFSLWSEGCSSTEVPYIRFWNACLSAVSRTFAIQFLALFFLTCISQLFFGEVFFLLSVHSCFLKYPKFFFLRFCFFYLWENLFCFLMFPWRG